MLAVIAKGPGEMESGFGFFLLEDEPDPQGCKLLPEDMAVPPESSTWLARRWSVSP